MKAARTGEYITFGFSLVLIAGLLSWLLYTSFSHDSEERLEFSTSILWEDVSDYKGKTIVPVRVENLGNKTANTVMLKIKTPEFETEAEIEYLPRSGSRKIFVMLPGRPEKDAISVMPIFYLLE